MIYDVLDNHITNGGCRKELFIKKPLSFKYFRSKKVEIEIMSIMNCLVKINYLQIILQVKELK